MNSPADWPAPSTEMLELQAALVARIRARMDARGGAISFLEFMELALYAPGLGYYSNGLRKFGAEGDFITAPELTPLFGRSLATQVEAVLRAVPGGDVLEFGAGSGALAIDLLRELELRKILPCHYCILERSAALRQCQREAIAASLPHLVERVHWLDRLPESFNGMMLANEVLDAAPVRRFQWTGSGVREYWVEWQGGGFAWSLRDADDERLVQVVTDFAHAYGWPSDYVSEWDPALAAWVGSVADSLRHGALLLIDYGSPRSERYHDQRVSGSLMCHYRHRAHGNPLILPGLQDITSYVDFTTVAEAGTDAGLALEGFSTQAHFLLDCGLDQLLMALEPDGSPRYLAQVQQAKQLVMPGEMGERFKCMALRRGIDGGLPGFRQQDLRGRL
ncbi:MAG: SAM-dependent methyltransferase [Gammaproteobacteria bacterium]|nr:SAM-dependent methyltransferase [Gammaproteobacteria bacterium]